MRPTPLTLLTATTYADRNLPDGTFAYQVYAMDRAGNLSGPSGRATVTIDTHAPHAVIAVPVDGTQLEGSLYVLATTPAFFADTAFILSCDAACFTCGTASGIAWTFSRTGIARSGLRMSM